MVCFTTIQSSKCAGGLVSKVERVISSGLRARIMLWYRVFLIFFSKVLVVAYWWLCMSLTAQQVKTHRKRVSRHCLQHGSKETYSAKRHYCVSTSVFQIFLFFAFKNTHLQRGGWQTIRDGSNHVTLKRLQLVSCRTLVVLPRYKRGLVV